MIILRKRKKLSATSIIPALLECDCGYQLTLDFSENECTGCRRVWSIFGQQLSSKINSLSGAGYGDREWWEEE